MLSPDDVRQAIEAVLEQLEQLRETLPTLANDAAVAEVDWKQEFAKARLNYRASQIEAGKSFTVSEVDDHATRQCKDEHMAHEISAARLGAARDMIRVLNTRCEALRTLSADLRTI